MFFAVIFEGYKILSDMITSAHQHDCDGLENIRRAYIAFYDFFRNNTQLLQLMTMEGIIKSYSENKDVPYRERVDRQTVVMFKSIIDLFVIAKSERRIRSDLDITLLAHSSIFIVTGFFHLFSLSGDSFARFLDIDRERFVIFCIDRMLDTLSV